MVGVALSIAGAFFICVSSIKENILMKKIYFIV